MLGAQVDSENEAYIPPQDLVRERFHAGRRQMWTLIFNTALLAQQRHRPVFTGCLTFDLVEPRGT